MNAKAGLSVFTESGVPPELIACDLVYTIRANVKTFNQFQLKLAIAVISATHMCTSIMD